MGSFNDFDECVICLQDISNLCMITATQNQETDFIPDQGDVLIKLLQMQANLDFDSNLHSTQLHKITKTESANHNLDTNKFKTNYCQSCSERNKDISDLFLEIGRLFRQLYEFQLSVKRDLSESLLYEKIKLSQLKRHQEELLSKSESLLSGSSASSPDPVKISSASIDQEHLHRKHGLRTKLVQLLQLPSTLKKKLSSETTEMGLPLSPSFLSNAHENSLDDEPPAGSINFDESYEYPAAPSTEETQNSSKFNIKSNSYSQPFNSDDGFSLARKLYGIKECSINVKKLTNSNARSSSLRKRVKSVLDTSHSAQAPPLSPCISELNSPSHSDNATDIGSIASFSSDDAVSSDTGPEDDDDGNTEYLRKPRKKYVKSKQSCLKNSRLKQSPQAKTVVVPKTQNNEPPKQKKKKPKKLPYKSLTIHCTREGCPRKQGFSTEEDLEYHVKQAHEGITHPFECTFPGCTKSFPQKKYLRRHYDSIHLGKFPHCCHFCGKGFTNTPNLKQHFITHTKVAAHKCTEPNCSRIFLTAHGLKYHKRSAHTGERPYRCDRCGKGFFTLFKLRDHIKALHIKGDKPFVCDICGKDFFIKKYLYMHVRNSHNNKKKIGPVPGEPIATIIIQETTETAAGEKLVLVRDNNNSETAGDIVIDITTNTDKNSSRSAETETESSSKECVQEFSPPKTDTLAAPVWISNLDPNNLFYPTYSVVFPVPVLNAARSPSSLQSIMSSATATAPVLATNHNPILNYKS